MQHFSAVKASEDLIGWSGYFGCFLIRVDRADWEWNNDAFFLITSMECLDDQCGGVQESWGAILIDVTKSFAKSDLMQVTFYSISPTMRLLLALNRRLYRSYNRVCEGNFSLEGLKTGKIGNLGIDVYEEEENLFFEDQSALIMQDDVFAHLLTFPNVFITGHQAFLTSNALTQIARTTLQNLKDLNETGACKNEVQA